MKVTSAPPSTLELESVRGMAPVKQLSFSVPEVGPVMQAVAQACERLQLFVSNCAPFLHRYTAPG